MSQSLARSEDRTARAVIEAKLADEGVIAQLRDTLYDRIGASGGDYWQLDPHLTVLPPFSIDPSKSHLVDDLIEDSGLVGQRVPITGVGLWPSVENPRVVLLTTPLDIEDERRDLIEGLRDLGACEMDDPVCPHITLFKTDIGYDTPEWLKERIQEVVWSHRFEWETELRYVDFKVVESQSVTADD